jgi:hypothetical protein
MTNLNKLEKLFNQLFIKPIEKKKRKEYKKAWNIRDDTDLCEILEKMNWINEELYGINSGAKTGFAELHYGEKKYWTVSSLRKNAQSRLLFLADHVGREGKCKVPCISFPNDPLDGIAELLLYYLKDNSEELKELVFGHTKQFFRNPPTVLEISNNGNKNKKIDTILDILAETYLPHMHNCVRVAYQDKKIERDVTFAELAEGTMICGYIPFKFLEDNL